MISQFKTLGGDNEPTISVYEGIDGLQFVALERGRKHYISIQIDDEVRNKWLRIGLDVLWSSGDDGAYRWWGDLDGDEIRDFEPLTDRRVVPTLDPGPDGNGVAVTMNIGPYHVTKENGGQDRNGRDYANIEFLDHPRTDPWGNGISLENCFRG